VNFFKRLSRWLDGDRWRQCNVPTPGERKAEWQRRLGEAKAEEELRKERLGQAFDLMASRKLATPKTNRLPGSKKPKLLRVVK